MIFHLPETVTPRSIQLFFRLLLSIVKLGRSFNSSGLKLVAAARIGAFQFRAQTDSLGWRIRDIAAAASFAEARYS